MFKHSCYIENSEEAREWLEMVGYEDSEYLMPIGEPVWSCLLTTKHGTFYSVPHNTVKTHIDCRGNLPLFKALTAVRDDSDYMQHFTDGIDWVFCEAETVKIIALCHFMNNNERVLRKATKEELIDHFKKEE